MQQKTRFIVFIFLTWITICVMVRTPCSGVRMVISNVKYSHAMCVVVRMPCSVVRMVHFHHAQQRSGHQARSGQKMWFRHLFNGLALRFWDYFWFWIWPLLSSQQISLNDRPILSLSFFFLCGAVFFTFLRDTDKNVDDFEECHKWEKFRRDLPPPKICHWVPTKRPEWRVWLLRGLFIGQVRVSPSTFFEVHDICGWISERKKSLAHNKKVTDTLEKGLRFCQPPAFFLTFDRNVWLSTWNVVLPTVVFVFQTWAFFSTNGNTSLVKVSIFSSKTSASQAKKKKNMKTECNGLRGGWHALQLECLGKNDLQFLERGSCNVWRNGNSARGRGLQSVSGGSPGRFEAPNVRSQIPR